MGPSPWALTRLPRSVPTAFRSAPAQNVPPAPHSTATRASASASNWRKASASAAAVGPSTALRASGRSRTIVVTGPARSVRMLTAEPRSARPQAASGFRAHLLHGVRFLVGVTFFRPGVGVHVVAVLLPEARRVDVEELEAAQPLPRLPEVELGQHQPHWAAVVGLEVLAVV